MLFRLLCLSLVSSVFINCSNRNAILGQYQPNDSFRKYSYLVMGVSSKSNEIKGFGTGFFIREKSRLFFFSASHIFNCIDVFHNVKIPIDSQWNFVLIRFYDDSTKKNAFTIVPIDSVKNRSLPFYWFNRPDLFCFEFQKPRHAIIYSVEKFVNQYDKDNGTPQKVFCYGYPRRDKIEKYDTVKSSYYEGAIYGGMLKDNWMPSASRYDTLNVVLTKSINGGFSGAPVFYQYSKILNKKPTHFITFGGLAFGGNDDQNIGWTVKAEVVIKGFDSLKAKAIP